MAETSNAAPAEDADKSGPLEQVLQVMAERFALFDSFAFADAERQRDVAEHVIAAARRGEREHVGRRVLAAEARVEGAQLGVVGEQDGEARLAAALVEQRRLRRPSRQRHHPRRGGAPAPRFDDDLDHRPRLAASAS